MEPVLGIFIIITFILTPMEMDKRTQKLEEERAKVENLDK